MQSQQIIFSFLISIFLFLILTSNKNIFGIDYLNNKSILFIFFSMSIIQFYEFYRRSLYVNGKFRELFSMDTFKYIMQLFLLTIFLSNDLKTSEIILMIFDTSCILSICLLVKNLPKLSLNKNSIFRSFQRNWNISKWLFLTSVVQWFQNNYLLFLTNFLLGPVALGVLRALQSILGISNIFLLSTDSWLPVKTSREFVSNTPKFFKKNIIKIFKKLSLFLIIFFLLLILISKYLLIFYNRELLDYLLIFRLYCIVYFFSSLIWPIKNILLGLENTKSYLMSYLFSIFLMIFFGKTLIFNYAL